jgi:hypothetical protein
MFPHPLKSECYLVKCFDVMILYHNNKVFDLLGIYMEQYSSLCDSNVSSGNLEVKAKECAPEDRLHIPRCRLYARGPSDFTLSRLHKEVTGAYEISVQLQQVSYTLVLQEHTNHLYSYRRSRELWCYGGKQFICTVTALIHNFATRQEQKLILENGN